VSGAAPSTRWWVDHGWWTHGSRLQTQLYVNCRADELTAKVFEAVPSLSARRPDVTWVTPLESNGFSEPRDRAMLRELGLQRLGPALASFWPAGGPVWDALAVCSMDDGSTGVVLAEGKNYPRELYSSGTAAGKSGTRRALDSRQRIERSVEWAQAELGVPIDASRWLDPLDPKRTASSLYQTANRLAYTVWLRSQGIDAWLCHLLFLGDRLHHPTSRVEWEQALEKGDRELGIDAIKIPFAGHAFLDALDPERELAQLRSRAPRA
jgi:hypothetical protein